MPPYKHKRKAAKCDKFPTKDQIPIEDLQNSVINLTDKVLTKDRLYVFHLGGSFAPTPHLPNLMKFKADVQKWIRSMRLSFNYSLCKSEGEILLPATIPVHDLITEIKHMERTIIKSTKSDTLYQSGETKSHALELFIAKVSEDITNYSSKCQHQNPLNIDIDTRSAISEMKKWDDVVIRRPMLLVQFLNGSAKIENRSTVLSRAILIYGANKTRALGPLTVV